MPNAAREKAGRDFRGRRQSGSRYRPRTAPRLVPGCSRGGVGRLGGFLALATQAGSPRRTSPVSRLALSTFEPTRSPPHNATRYCCCDCPACCCCGWQSAGCPDCCSTPHRATRERIGLLIPFRHGGVPQAESVPQNRARLRRAKGKRVKEQRVNQYHLTNRLAHHHTTQPDIADATERRAAVAVGRAQVGRTEVPRPTAQHASA